MNFGGTSKESDPQVAEEKAEKARAKAARLSVQRWEERNRGTTFTTSGRAIRFQLTFLAAITFLMLLLHGPLLTLPFHWDELGQFVPSALDLFRDGAWITHTAQPNIHPPGLSVILALVWKVTGYSILSSRIAMVLIASIGVWLSFLLTIRLGRGTAGAPAFAAVGFLILAPMFYTQSMMVLLDMPAMTFTVLALLLFLDESYAWCALTCTVLVLIKETAITTPMVFGAWLLFKDRRTKQALYFFAPALAFGVWLIALHHGTGSWFGNEQFGAFNVTESLSVEHILYAIFRRIFALFIADGHWIGAIALYTSWRQLKGKNWTIALLVAVAQVVFVTILGGAVLDRYLLPVLPILYAAIAIAASAYPPGWRITSHAAMAALLFAGWFVNPPFPFPLENNLAVVDFVRLQRDAAEYLEASAGNRRIATVWPFSIAALAPDYGYVSRPLNVVAAASEHAADLEKLNLNAPGDRVDVIVLFSRGGYPPDFILKVDRWRNLLARFNDLHPHATPEELDDLGFRSQRRFERGGQWIEIYSRYRL